VSDVLAHLREGAALDLARRLVATPSVNPPGDERAAAQVVCERLDEAGIEWEVVAAEEHRPNVIAHVRGAEPGRTLILNGHLDTKPPGDLERWARDPWGAEVDAAGELHGLGSGDMKASVAAMVEAACALRAWGLPRGELTLVLTADEEAGSVLGARFLAENGHLRADAAIIGEPCGIVREWEAIDLVSRGAALFRVRVTGTQMHSSLSDRLPAVNATVQMGRLVDRMHRELRGRLTYDEHPIGGGPTVNVGVTARAGVFYGVYPGEAEFACDLRTVPGMTRESVEADLRAFLDDARADDPELDAELDFEVWVPPSEIAPDEPVVLALREAAASVLGEEPPLAAFPGATDAPHFQLTAGIPTVAAFGPGFLTRAHAPNESLPAASVEQAARIYSLAAAAFLR
jgi:acetylornithine deacetylase